MLGLELFSVASFVTDSVDTNLPTELQYCNTGGTARMPLDKTRRGRRVDQLGMPLVTEPLILKRERIEQQRFLERHPYLSSATVVTIREITTGCAIAHQSPRSTSLAGAYTHLKNCSACAAALEKHRRRQGSLIGSGR